MHLQNNKKNSCGQVMMKPFAKRVDLILQIRTWLVRLKVGRSEVGFCKYELLKLFAGLLKPSRWRWWLMKAAGGGCNKTNIDYEGCRIGVGSVCQIEIWEFRLEKEIADGAIAEEKSKDDLRRWSRRWSEKSADWWGLKKMTVDLHDLIFFFFWKLKGKRKFWGNWIGRETFN